MSILGARMCTDYGFRVLCNHSIRLGASTKIGMLPKRNQPAELPLSPRGAAAASMDTGHAFDWYEADATHILFDTSACMQSSVRVDGCIAAAAHTEGPVSSRVLFLR